MFKKIFKILGILAGVLVLGFGVLIFLSWDSDLPEPGAPVIVSVEFPEHILKNQEVDGTITFKDYEGDVEFLRTEDLEIPGDSIDDLRNVDVPGSKSGAFLLGQLVDEDRVSSRRLILIDAAGNESKPVILQYTVGEASKFLERYDREQTDQRPVFKTKKLHFFILSGTDSDLEDGVVFPSEAAATAAAAPAVVTMMQNVVVPAINGVWDQCGFGFELGQVKVVRPEKIKTPGGRTLSSLFGDFKDGRAVVLPNANFGTNNWVDNLLPVLGVKDGDYAIFLFGYTIWIRNTGEKKAGFSAPQSIIASWQHVHFLNEETGEIIIPKSIMSTIAHELGHVFGLPHPEEENRIDQKKFNEFNLMNSSGGTVAELIPEQCGIVAGQF